MFSSRTFSPIGLAGYDVFIITGQSNASGAAIDLTNPEIGNSSVSMLGNDYIFKRAVEPVDNNANQIDSISQDSSSLHSCWLKAARLVSEDSGRKIMLVPCAKGTTLWQSSTATESWMPQSDVLNRSTLFGSANYRRIVAGGTVKAVWIWGHETSTEISWSGVNYLSTYKTDMTNFIAALRTHYGNASLPIIFAQLGACNQGAATAPTAWNDTTEVWHRVSVAREYMRQIKSEVANVAMVPTWDLPLEADGIHLNRTGMNEVARRFALATEIRAYGFAGIVQPSPVSVVVAPANTITINFDAAVVDDATQFEGQFKVWDNSSLETITGAVSSGNSIVITIAGTITGTCVVTHGQTKRAAQLTTHARSTSSAVAVPAFSMGP